MTVKLQRCLRFKRQVSDFVLHRYETTFYVRYRAVDQTFLNSPPSPNDFQSSELNFSNRYDEVIELCQVTKLPPHRGRLVQSTVKMLFSIWFQKCLWKPCFSPSSREQTVGQRGLLRFYRLLLCFASENLRANPSILHRASSTRH